MMLSEIGLEDSQWMSQDTCARVNLKDMNYARQRRCTLQAI